MLTQPAKLMTCTNTQLNLLDHLDHS